MDATIYAIVLHPALHDLLHSASGPPATEQIGWYGGIIFSIFLIGWAIGGITFGILADRFGRTKVLIATIIIYAVFTGAAALSETWWHLAIYRFLTALGIGGEWALSRRHPAGVCGSLRSLVGEGTGTLDSCP